MISNYFTTEFTIKRMSYVANKGSKADVGTFKGHLQQAGAEIVQQMANLYTITHIVWCAVDTDIQASDEINDGTDYFEVKAIQKNDMGDNRHLELVCEKHI